jgi:hypothetical protein
MFTVEGMDGAGRRKRERLSDPYIQRKSLAIARGKQKSLLHKFAPLPDDDDDDELQG